MKRIEICVYKFDELEPVAQEVALKDAREKYDQIRSESDWSDANATIAKIEELSGVHVDIQSSSQGHYYNRYVGEGSYYPYSDEVDHYDKWKIFMYDMLTMETSDWSDEMLVEVFREYEFDEKKSFPRNFADCLVKYCNNIESMMSEPIDDLDIVGFIEEQGFQYLADGRVFNI